MLEKKLLLVLCVFFCRQKIRHVKYIPQMHSAVTNRTICEILFMRVTVVAYYLRDLVHVCYKTFNSIGQELTEKIHLSSSKKVKVTMYMLKKPNRGYYHAEFYRSC